MIYKCPRCFGTVSHLNNSYSCQKCFKSWSESSDYPDFLEETFYWGEIPQELMREICDYARRYGWESALEEKVRSSYPNIYTYVTEQNRADWRILLDIDENSVALDLGAGWGTISLLISDYIKEVHALEGIKERVEFINIRRLQEGKLNVYPVRADFNNPPFFENSLDLIICNGVLEWVGLNDLKTSPRDAQVNFLKRLLGLLKQKGILYIGIENRFSYGSFIGAVDHSGLPYTNLLPRIMADIVVRLNAMCRGKTRGFFLNRRGGYRTYTYSFNGYRKLLRDTGFSDIKIYFAIPSYNSPATLIPIDSPDLYKFYLKTMRPYPLKMPKKILRKTYEMFIDIGIQKWFENAFSIIAIK